MARSLPRSQEARSQDPVHARSPNRVRLYRELIAITRATLADLEQASERLAVASTPLIALWQVQVRHYQPLVERIIRQSERRVLAGEQVAADEKLVSLFE